MLDDQVSVILKTEDVPRTIEWYQRVGFRLRGVFPDTAEPTWCELSRDSVVLQFLGGETPWPEPPSFTGTIYFYPESVEALYEEIKDHTPTAWGPEVRDWGAGSLDCATRTDTSSPSPKRPTLVSTRPRDGRTPRPRPRRDPPSGRPRRGRHS